MNAKHLALCIGLFLGAVVFCKNEQTIKAKQEPVLESPVLTLDQAQAIINAQNKMEPERCDLSYTKCKQTVIFMRYMLILQSKTNSN